MQDVITIFLASKPIESNTLVRSIYYDWKATIITEEKRVDNFEITKITSWM